MLFCSKTNKAQINPLGKYTISISPFQLLLQEATFNIHRSIKRNSFGIQLAYKFKTNWDQNIKSPYYNFNQKFERNQYSVGDYQSYTISLNLRHYLKDDKNVYWESQLFYRNWWQSNEYTINWGGVDKISLTDKTRILGLKLLIGHTSLLSKKGRVRFILDKYGGLGIRDRKNGPYINSVSTTGATYYFRHHTVPGDEGFKFSIHLGLVLGISFHPKNNTK